MAYVIIRPADRQGWLAQREKGIGSSEVGTILGVNPYDTPYQLWRRKKGLSAPVQENEAMRAGHLLESAVATYFEQESGRKIIKASEGDWLAVDLQRDYLRVSPDRTYWLSQSHRRGNRGILECKTTQMDINPDELPMHWFCQLQYQLGVMNLPQGSLAWLTRGRKFDYKDFAFDPDFYAYLVEAIDRFYKDCILGNQEPPVSNVEDVLVKYQHSSDRVIEADGKIMADITTLKSLRPQIEELTSQKKEVEDRIKMRMADADTICMAGSKEQNPIILCTWKSAKDSSKFDEKRFAADHPELYTSYLTSVPGSRRFNLK